MNNREDIKKFILEKFGIKLKYFEFLKEKGYSLDHKFSVRAGFDNNISTDIISHWKNLEVMTFSKNAKKHKKCSITIEKLNNEIEGLIK